MIFYHMSAVAVKTEVFIYLEIDFNTKTFFSNNNLYVTTKNIKHPPLTSIRLFTYTTCMTDNRY